MVIHSRPVEPLLVRARELGIADDLARTIQERAHRYAQAMGLEPAAAEARLMAAAVAAREAGSTAELMAAEAALREIDLRVNDLNPALNLPGSARIGIFGWGLVGPQVSTVDEFRRKIRQGGTWLEPFNGFGPDNFMVGMPRFDFGVYKPWIDERFEASRFAQIEKKLGANVKFAIGCFVQALAQNPGIEQTLIDFGLGTHIYIGTGVGDIPTMYQINVGYYKAQRRWNRFWAVPARNAPLREYLALAPAAQAAYRTAHGVPADPETAVAAARRAAESGDGGPAGDAPDGPEPGVAGDETYFDEVREAARDAWEAYWAARSEQLAAYLRESAALHDVDVAGDIEKDKVRVIKKRLHDLKKLNQKWGIPPEPWAAVSANRIWNIDNVPAAQIAMLGRIHGPSFAPVGACSGFDIALELGCQAIRENRAKAVVVGMVDPPPHPLLVGAFYDARVIAADTKVSLPLTGLRGTHVSGGALLWIIGDLDAMLARGHRPIGCEIIGNGSSSDAYHIITPSKTGPRLAIERALQRAGVRPEEVDTWDLHATATPGDFSEVQLAVELLGQHPVLTAKKGVFGHGMSVGGGWELTAQHMAMTEGVLPPCAIPDDRLNPEITKLSTNIVADRPRAFEGKIGGKINMGIGGINGVVISKIWEFDPTVRQLAAVLQIEPAVLRRRIEAGEIEGYVDAHGIERVPYAEYRRLAGEP